MVHEDARGKYFFVNDTPTGWISLEAPDGKYLPGFYTKRIAKVYSGERLYFTIGETQKGKRNCLSKGIG